MTTKEKISKTVNSIKQKSFGHVSEDWLHAFKQGMEVAIEAEGLEYKERTCESCRRNKFPCMLEELSKQLELVNFGCTEWENKNND